jgi:hypothetical protein
METPHKWILYSTLHYPYEKRLKVRGECQLSIWSRRTLHIEWLGEEWIVPGWRWTRLGYRSLSSEDIRSMGHNDFSDHFSMAAVGRLLALMHSEVTSFRFIYAPASSKDVGPSRANEVHFVE